MSNWWKIYLVMAALLLSADMGFAQLSKREMRRGTTNTSTRVSQPTTSNARFRDKNIDYIIKSDTRNTLYGNKCVSEMSHKMGFEFLIMPKAQTSFGDKIGFFFNNFGVKTKLFFKNGPFWRIKFNRRVKKCRKLSGDYVG